MSIVDLVSKIQKLSDDKIQSVEDYVDSLMEVKESKQFTKVSGYGSLKGKIWVSEDFDAPLEDFKEYM